MCAGYFFIVIYHISQDFFLMFNNLLYVWLMQILNKVELNLPIVQKETLFILNHRYEFTITYINNNTNSIM